MPERHLSGLDKTFYVSLILKAIDSALEVAGGIFLLVISPDSINRWARDLTESELSQDPHDFVANHILKVSHDFAHGGRWFAAVYLLSHGIVKLVVIAALFKQKLWAYPALLVVLGAFVVYQVYRLTYKFSIGLVLLTVFDLFVMWLTWREYQKHLADK
jgi:uncharacterized membrane protein